MTREVRGSWDAGRKCCWVCTELHWGADLVRTHQPSHYIQAESWSLLTSQYNSPSASWSLVFTSAVCFSVHISSLSIHKYLYLSAHGCGVCGGSDGWWCSEWSLEPTECGGPMYTCTAYTGQYCALLHCTPLHRQYSTAWLYKTIPESHYNTAVVRLENMFLYKTLTFCPFQEIIYQCIPMTMNSINECQCREHIHFTSCLLYNTLQMAVI